MACLLNDLQRLIAFLGSLPDRVTLIVRCLPDPPFHSALSQWRPGKRQRDAICNVRFNSTPAVSFAQIAVISGRLGERVNTTRLSRPAGRKRRSARVHPAVSVRSAARLAHVLLDATPIFGVEPREALLASPFRPRLGVRCGWRPFPKDSSYGQTTR